jgi:hypothetical protein
VGGTLGVATSSSLFAEHISRLTDVLSAEQISTLYRNPGFISQLELLQQVAVREAFAQAFNECLRVCTYVAAISFVLSLFVWQRNPPSIAERKNQLEAAMLDVPDAAGRDSEQVSVKVTVRLDVADGRSGEVNFGHKQDLAGGESNRMERIADIE